MWVDWRNHRGRHLPFTGAIGDQPAALWDAFGVLSRISDEAEKDGCSD